VIVDATAMVMWVSQGPHLLGRYVAVDLRRELAGEERAVPADLPEDPIAGSAELRQHQLAVAELRAARALREVDPERALEQARRAAALDDRMPEAHLFLGELLRRRDPNRARAELERFLDLQPPYLRDVERVKGILSTM